MKSTTTIAAIIGCSLAIGLAGCEKQAAKPARGDAATTTGQVGAVAGSDRYADNGSAARQARDDGPTYKDGKPTWASNRKHTSAENEQYQFSKHGSEFGAASADDYVAKVHAFLASPPSGVDTATRDRNGDKLYYDAKSNTFVVATRDGAPRTMMKPPSGEAFWTKAKANVNETRAGGYGRTPRAGGSGGSDDNG